LAGRTSQDRRLMDGRTEGQARQRGEKKECWRALTAIMAADSSAKKGPGRGFNFQSGPLLLVQLVSSVRSTRPRRYSI